MTPVPLARLLAVAYRSIIDDLHRQLQARGWTDVRPAFGFVLLATREGPVTSTQLGELMGTTKQAASKLLDSMVEGGYVERRTGADGRERLIHLTRRGRRLLTAVEEIYTSIEQGWADVIGERDVERLRSSLTRVVTAGTDGVLPPVRPTW